MNAQTTINRRALIVSSVVAGASVSATLGRAAAMSEQVAGPFDMGTTTVDWVSGASPLSHPAAMAIAPTGRLHVVDSDRKRVAVFDKGAFVREWGDSAISGAITGIAIDRLAHVYLADADASAIRVYDTSGRPLDVITTCANGRTFSDLTALMFADDGSLFVADGPNVMQLSVPSYGHAPDGGYLPDKPHPLP